jgi:hypothetical protein
MSYCGYCDKLLMRSAAIIPKKDCNIVAVGAMVYCKQWMTNICDVISQTPPPLKGCKIEVHGG